MRPTDEQIQLIDRLQLLGAIVPEDDHGNPSSAMFEDANAAQFYIAEWSHLIKSDTYVLTLYLSKQDISISQSGDWTEFKETFADSREEDWITLKTPKEEVSFRKADIMCWHIKCGS